MAAGIFLGRGMGLLDWLCTVMCTDTVKRSMFGNRSHETELFGGTVLEGLEIICKSSPDFSSLCNCSVSASNKCKSQIMAMALSAYRGTWYLFTYRYLFKRNFNFCYCCRIKWYDSYIW